jgi:hypothetical protein
MNPEIPNQEKAPIKAEHHYGNEFSGLLSELLNLKTSVLRGEREQGQVDALRDRIHGLVDEACNQIEWLARKKEIGDMDQERFEPSSWDKQKKQSD